MRVREAEEPNILPVNALTHPDPHLAIYLVRKLMKELSAYPISTHIADDIFRRSSASSSRASRRMKVSSAHWE